jgi:signal transduction histidine kinase
LGLSISRGIIKDHGGEITVVKDCPNTCFEVRLPSAYELIKKTS